MLWTPQGDWAGQLAIVVGTGPSVTPAQISAVKRVRARGGCRVLAINDAGLDFRDAADIIFSSQENWWRIRDHVPGFAGARVSLLEGYRKAPSGMLLVRRSGCDGFDDRPGFVSTHGNSGAMAVQIANQLQADVIALLGFDMRRGPDGAQHYFGNYPHPLHAEPDMAKWANLFRVIATALGPRLISVTPGSALNDFVRYLDLQSVLEGVTHGNAC